jgi:diguanylate cyclase (GGDEF)-like protein/PAS domain S-box-containing protein
MSLEEIQQLQDTLADMHQVASVITDAEGNYLTIPSNEISVCRLIRNSAMGFAHCMSVSLTLAQSKSDEGQPICEMCRRLGVLNAVVPIFVDQKHLANWWVSQYCGAKPSRDQLVVYAKKADIDADALADAFQYLPAGDEKNFYRILEWIRSLSHQFARWIYENHLLYKSLSRLDRMESELDKHRSQMEKCVIEQTAELIKANNRLQLEVLERELAEEQTERKSRLLNAINSIFQQTITDQSNQSLANTFLAAARRLTNSPYGFIAEQQEGRWQLVAIHSAEEKNEPTEHIAKPDESEISRLWRQLIIREKPLAMPGIDDDFQFEPLPKSFPNLKTFLTVALGKDQRISGLIAVAQKEENYAFVDQNDVEVLAQAFIEALLRRRVEADKAGSEKRLNLALESTNEGLWDYNPIRGDIYYSPRWFTMLGYNPGELPETLETWSTLCHPDDLTVLENALHSFAAGKEEALNVEIRMLSRTGQWRWLQVRGRTVERDDDDRVLRVVGTLIDISKYKQVEVALQKANDELQRLAALDDLTQIANRRRFEDRLAQEWRRGQRENSMLAVIICDIDYFKKYNDTYGHLKGDETLYAVAQAISTALRRPMDLVARYGGEEFAMILPNTDIAGAQRVAQEVKKAVAALSIEHQSSKVNPDITLSFGVAAITPAPEQSSRILIETADRALYKAKAKGRNQILCVSREEEENA